MTNIDGRKPRDESVHDTLRDAYGDHVDQHDYNENQHKIEHEQELELHDEDEPLPWLDSDYDENYDDGDNVDALRVLGFVLLGLLAIGLFLGVLYWLFNRSPDPELTADGSTIAAPEGPVKERPEDAGGREFEGTGNVAPKVGEGQTSEGQIGDGQNTPEPGIETGAPDNSGNSDAKTDGEAASGGNASGDSGEASNNTGGVGVQVAAYSNRESAVAGWRKLNSQTSALNGFNYRVVEAQVDGSRVFRLQAVASDADSARQLCDALKADGLPCQVKR